MPGPLAQFFNDAIFRIYRNRRFMGFKVLMLTTVGARSGQMRRTTLGFFVDPDNADAWIIVASAGGAASHPGWYFNLARNPEQVWIEVGKQKLRVAPEQLKGAERAAAWQRVVTEAPGYATYETKTDREIPLVRLTPGD
jgi:deazaflavin-dependent oxidoreductase (nitroreductase family)